MLILWPTLAMLVFLGAQIAVYYYARTVAIAAAQEGAEQASGHDGAPGDGVGGALAYLRDAGEGSFLQHAQASEQHAPTTVTVTITGTSLSLVPGWRPVVHQSSTASIERLTSP